MQKLFLNKDKSEQGFNQFVWNNQKDLFLQDNFIFIKQEFSLEGDGGGKKFIDILAYNPATDRFVIFELKRGKDEYAVYQAMKYRERVLKTVEKVHFIATHEHKKELPPIKQIDRKAVDIIVLAEEFDKDQIAQAKDMKKGIITLIKYCWFENDFIFFDYVNNATVTLQGEPQPPPKKNAKPNKKSVEKLKAKNWDDIVGSLRDKNTSKKIQSIPYKKENAHALREIIKVEAVPTNKRAALLELLDELKTQD